ncbi:hypothetical protein [Sphingomonas cavernae]|nr:hypothetical protein [Sphingomonas cavernae]
MRLLVPAILLALVPLGAAHAQERERINQIVVYGDDPCPPSTGDEIVVCARKSENERFRIPENLRGNPTDPARDSWVNRAERLEYVGRSGIGSCTPTGSGGASGCFNQLMRQAREELAVGDGTNWTQLVEAARQERLGQIDEQAERIEAQIKAEEEAKAPQ